MIGVSFSRALFKRISLALALAALIVASIAAATLGSVRIPFVDVVRIVWSGIAGTGASSIDPTWSTIVLNIRLPRVAMALVVGGVLAVSGAAYQAIFRNPLADPYLVGVSSGASFGAALAIVVIGQTTLLGFGLVTISAFAFAIGATLFAYTLSRVGRRTAVTLLILSGVALGSVFSAATTLLMLSAPSAFQAMEVLSWILGSLSRSTWQLVAATLPFAAVGIAISLVFAYRLNLLQLGEEQAQLLGVPVERVRAVLIAAVSLATAAAVSVSGVVGFVGLVVPHLVRLAWGPDHRFLVPMSSILGATLLVLADCLARTAFAPREIPLGVVTACLGVPFFLVLLRRQRRSLM